MIYIASNLESKAVTILSDIKKEMRAVATQKIDKPNGTLCQTISDEQRSLIPEHDRKINLLLIKVLEDDAKKCDAYMQQVSRMTDAQLDREYEMVFGNRK